MKQLKHLEAVTNSDGGVECRFECGMASHIVLHRWGSVQLVCGLE